jgi:hypothetical protein
MKIFMLRALGLFIFSSSVNVFGATIPFNFYANPFDGGKIYIPCTYNKMSNQCYFDLGADNSVANNAATKSLPVIKQVSFVGGGNVSKTCDLVSISSWSAGSFGTSNVEAVRCADSVPADVIGKSFFDGHNFSIDFKTQKIETDVTFPADVPTNSMTVYPSGHIGMDIEIADKPFKVIFDTGAGISAVDETLVAEMPQIFRFIQFVQGTDSTGAPVSFKLYQMSGLKVGNILFPESFVLAIDFSVFKPAFPSSMRVLLGPSVMTNHKWFLDIKSKTWAVM